MRRQGTNADALDSVLYGCFPRGFCGPGFIFGGFWGVVRQKRDISREVF